ncbi:sensor histidine kinase [Saccharothrix australiensis]|uniref:sensor histidine kinase n=1 Tax=Saccharothrix australiensis TaxID=2072 RepID=UPI0014774400|nr:sensor histidine kinase [Saccharothrix australiensis]
MGDLGIGHFVVRGERYWRGVRFHDVYVVVETLMTAALVVSVKPPVESTRTVGAVVLLALIAVAYFALGRREMVSPAKTRRGALYIALVYACYFGAVSLSLMALLVLLMLWPQMFILLRLPWAVLLSAVAFLSPFTVTLAASEEVLAVQDFVGFAVVSIALLLSGWWAGRVVDQSTERARLIEQLRVSRAETARLAHQAGISAERERLAADIHDTLAQGFAGVITLIQAATATRKRDPQRADRSLDLAVRTARENLMETRALIAALTPGALAGGSLADAVGTLVAHTGEALGIAAHYRVHGTPRRLRPALEVAVLRVAQEALNNVRKHARATALTVDLRFGDREVGLTVADDGVGFDPADARDGFGLGGMCSRVQQVGGAFRVTSAPSLGATIHLEVPT